VRPSASSGAMTTLQLLRAARKGHRPPRPDASTPFCQLGGRTLPGAWGDAPPDGPQGVTKLPLPRTGRTDVSDVGRSSCSPISFGS
jgi:hypothetical protein